MQAKTGLKLGVLVVVAAACNKSDETATLAAHYGYEEQIHGIVQQKCQGCHQASGTAPFALESYEQLAAHAEASALAIEQGRMPPWGAKRECRSYHGDYSLTSEEKSMFLNWARAGAPRTVTEQPNYTPVPEAAPRLSRVDLELFNSEPYQPRPAPDETRCFVIDWPYQEVKYITGNDVQPGDPSLVHHVSIYLSPGSDREFYLALDAKHQGPRDGYPCSATMGVGKASARWIGGWLPGLSGFEYPLNAGMRVEPGTVVILQVHYHKPVAGAESHGAHAGQQGGAGEGGLAPDQTKVLLKIESAVDLVGALVTFTNPDWMVELEMDIPSGQKSVRHEFAGALDHIPKLIGQEFPLAGDEFDIQSINMHGHALMSKARMKLLRNDQSEECLLDIEHFSARWQLNYIFKESVRVRPGDRVYLSCEWDNSPENQMVVDGKRLEPKPTNWGDGARDEMCFGLMFVTEKKP